MAHTDRSTVDAAAPGVPGVRDAAAEKVTAMLISGRRYFGSAGASLTRDDATSQFGSGAVRAGLAGERSTSTILQRWMQDKDGVVVVDSVHIGGVGSDGGDTDHVVVVGHTVVLVDTKRWKGHRVYSVDNSGKVLMSRGKGKPPGPFPGGEVHARAASALWRTYLGKGVHVSPTVCVNADKVWVSHRKGQRWPGFRLVSVDHLAEELDRTYQKVGDAATRIDAGLVSQVVVCCVKPYDPWKHLFTAEAVIMARRDRRY